MRTFERSDHAAWSNNFGKIDSCVAGASTNVEHVFADCDPCPLPAIQNNRAPNAMLESQPGEFLVVRAENVIAVCSHS
jgi:hypothetical protein